MAVWAALATLLVACVGGASDPAVVTKTVSAPPDMGTIAYVDAGGCIARVPANGTPATDQPFCPQTRQGVTYVAWQDAASIAYVTPETAALGWRLVDFRAKTDELLPVDESPRIRILTTAPWYRSVQGEAVEVGSGGVVSRIENGQRIAIFTPGAGNGATGTARLATWSPDSQWLLLFVSPGDALWVVRRDGSSAWQVAASSRGQVAWFMPGVGALPHLDLTCTTVAAFDCTPAPQSPQRGAKVVASPDGTVHLTWSVCPGATGYEVEVLPAGSDVPVISHLSVGTTFRVPVSALSGGGNWRWRVRSLIGDRAAPWSEEAAFALG